MKIKEFLEANPHQSEFEQNIIHYVGLEDAIKEEPEVLTAGAIALVTGMSNYMYFYFICIYRGF